MNTKDEIRKYFIHQDRMDELDMDFLDFEIERAKEADLQLLLQAKRKGLHFSENPHNSILLYAMNLTDDFDFKKARSDLAGGAAPDIDMDYSAEGRDKVIEWIVQEWGRDCVANIGTHGTFGAKSLTRRYFKLSEPGDPTRVESHYKAMQEILDKIPEPLFGKEASFEEIIEGNKDKNYPAHPELKEDPKYLGWYAFAKQLEGMVANYGVHAAGMVVSSFPIHSHIPMWKNGDYERITQFDMHDVEALGLIKFDFLVIKNLDILQQCVKLIKERHGKAYDIYNIEDGDVPAYSLMATGHLTGIFQFEESSTIKQATVRAAPRSIEELSDISSLVRPGPASAGFLDRYLDNERDPDIPDAIANMWSDTRGVLVYQEQLIRLFTDVAGLSLEDADTARRAVGKKDKAYLDKLTVKFAEGCQKYGLTEAQINRLWAVIVGCADYLFNKSHAIAYSYISYLCAYFKANYPTEFFCALMTVRSQSMQPKDWAMKATEYIQEAEALGVKILPPSVQKSDLGFHIVGEGEIYFGLNGIRSCGKTASKCIVQARGKAGFKDINDFVDRMNTTKVNTSVFKALVTAGAFDTMGYKRQDLLEHTDTLYDYKRDLQEWYLRKAEIVERDMENARLTPLIDKRNELRTIQSRKKGRELTETETQYIHDTEELRKKPSLKEKDQPVLPELTRYQKIPVTIEQMMEQQAYIGCFLGKHPARMIYPEAESLAAVYEGISATVSGIVIEARELKTKTGQNMAIYEIGDGTATAKIVVFPRSFSSISRKGKLPNVRDIIRVTGKVDKEAPMIEIFADQIEVHRS
jgi:DNA-directed DNA polymerase III PolC